MKGILLAGGFGTRLNPITNYISKHLMPVYNKPMISYSLATLMLANIKEILIISTKRDVPMIQQYLGNGKNLGINLYYKVQEHPNGIAEAFILGEDFINYSNVCLMLGDNFFYASNFLKLLKQASNLSEGAYIFAYKVNDPKNYGIVEIDLNYNIISIEEKPINPRSSLAITGLYFYDKQVVNIAKTLMPSARGELEITDLNRVYLQANKLKVEILSRGATWVDLGTFENLLNVSNFVNIIEHRQNLQIACLEEIAYRMKFIDKHQFQNLINLSNTQNKEYLQNILNEENFIN